MHQYSPHTVVAIHSWHQYSPHTVVAIHSWHQYSPHTVVAIHSWHQYSPHTVVAIHSWHQYSPHTVVAIHSWHQYSPHTVVAIHSWHQARAPVLQQSGIHVIVPVDEVGSVCPSVHPSLRQAGWPASRGFQAVSGKLISQSILNLEYAFVG